MLIRRFQSARKRKKLHAKTLLFHYFMCDSKANSGCTKAPYKQCKLFMYLFKVRKNNLFQVIFTPKSPEDGWGVKQSETKRNIVAFTFGLLRIHTVFFFKRTKTFWIALNYWNDCLTIGQNWEQEVCPFCQRIDLSRHNKQ